MQESQIAAIIAEIADTVCDDHDKLKQLRQALWDILKVQWQTKNFHILISGIQPGTGSTTTKKLLNKVLDAPSFYDSGFYRRVIAHYWSKYADEHGGRTQANWNTFEEQFVDDAQGTLQVVIATSGSIAFSDENLISFNQDQARFSSNSTMWESLPDHFSFQEIETQSRGVWQGKLTALIDVILREKIDTLTIPVFRILLTIDPIEAARRVSDREGGGDLDQVQRDNEERRLRDWEAFRQLYGIDPQIFDRRSDLLHIDTSRLSASEVVAKVLMEMTKRVRD